MVGIIFTRNVFAVAILFALTPWIAAMGLANIHIILAVLIFLIQLLPLPFLRWGKAARASVAGRYQKRVLRQTTQRQPL